MMRLRSEAKNWNRARPQLWAPAAPMHFPGAGKNALSYGCVGRTSFLSRFVHRAVTSRPSVPPKVDSKVFAAVGLGGAAQPRPARRVMLSHDLFERPDGAESRRRVVRQMVMEMVRKA